MPIARKRKDFVQQIIVSFLNNSTKRSVLQAAWAKKEVMLKDKQIYFDHDYLQVETTKIPVQTCQSTAKGPGHQNALSDSS